jgi:hypothetical protein
MGTKLSLIAITLALASVLTPRANAGTDMIIDNSAQTMPPPRPVYHYARPRPVFYAPPPPVVVVYPRPFVRFGYHRPYYVRHGHWHPHWH